MPPLPVVAGGYLVTQKLDYVGHERHTFVTVHCVISVTTGATLAQIATSFADAYAHHLMLPVTNGIVMGSTTVLPLDGASSTAEFSTASAGTVGGQGVGNALPNALAFVIAWKTGLRGRSHRGRTYLPGVTDVNLFDPQQNLLRPAAVSAVQAAADGFIANLATEPTAAMRLAVLSRKLGTAGTVTTARADSKVGVQRRRYEAVARR